MQKPMIVKGTVICSICQAHPIVLCWGAHGRALLSSFVDSRAGEWVFPTRHERCYLWDKYFIIGERCYRLLRHGDGPQVRLGCEWFLWAELPAKPLSLWGGFATAANLAHLEGCHAISQLQKKKMMLNFLQSVRETSLEKFQEHCSQMTDGKIILQNPGFSIKEQNTCPCFPYTSAVRG